MKKCTNCGNTATDDIKFCNNCGGTNFEPVAGGGYQQQPYQQPAYQQPYQQPAYQAGYSNTEPARIKDFIIFFLLMLIPIFNIIYAIIVAVGGPKYNVSLTNFVRAAIIFGLIISAIYVIIFLIVGASIFSMFGGYGGMGGYPF